VKHCYMCKLPIVSYGDGRTRRHVCNHEICSECYCKIVNYMNAERAATQQVAGLMPGVKGEQHEG
jgi:hypothetical protein